MVSIYGETPKRSWNVRVFANHGKGRKGRPMLVCEQNGDTVCLPISRAVASILVNRGMALEG